MLLLPNERIFLTIGNFRGDANTNFNNVNNTIQTTRQTTYYVVDILVIPLNDSMPLQADAGKDTTLLLGIVYLLAATQMALIL